VSLTAKQERFVAEYLIDLNATQAAIRAGYSEKTATEQGSRLLTNVKVQQAITKGQNKTAEKLEITKDRIVEELAKIGFSNMLDYMRAGSDGDPYLDFSDLTREQAAALSEVTVEDFKDGRGEDARDVRRIKFKLHDKKGALVDLAKMLGFMVEKHEHSGPDGAPIQTETRTWREVLRSEKS
jgi:phage terminase small subunit